MSATAILRTRIDPRRKAIPFPVAVEDNSDIAPPIEHVAKVWGDLDQTDFSHLDKR